MSFYLSQKCWGRSCLHLAAAMRAGHWQWHFAGIGREMRFTLMTLNGPATRTADDKNAAHRR
jgi:hypothetical protein